MPDIVLQSVSVVTDRGSREGRLVMAGADLVAVLTRVTPEESPSKDNPGGNNRFPGWFLEAGFGPCGPLMVVTPSVFASLDEAVEWVCGRLAEGGPNPKA
jgi:hypothetical protein